MSSCWNAEHRSQASCRQGKNFYETLNFQTDFFHFLQLISCYKIQSHTDQQPYRHKTGKMVLVNTVLFISTVLSNVGRVVENFVNSGLLLAASKMSVFPFLSLTLCSSLTSPWKCLLQFLGGHVTSYATKVSLLRDSVASRSCVSM